MTSFKALKSIPVCVKWLIAVNSLFFVLIVAHGGIVLGSKVILSVPGGLLVEAGGFYLPNIKAGEYWRIISYAFLHGNIIHLVFNMLALWQVGSPLELEIGWRRFFSLYILTSIAAIVWSAVLTPETITIGASGALFGLIGFAISFYHRIGSEKARARRNLMIQWAIYAITFGFIMGADNGAHIGGAVAGTIMGFFAPVSARQIATQSALSKGVNGTIAVIVAVSLSVQLVVWIKNFSLLLKTAI